MKQKLLRLRSLAARQEAKVAAGVALALVSAGAMAQTTGTPDLGSVLDTLIGGIITGVGTTFAKVTPLMVLVFGVAFAWRWVKRGSKG